MASHNSFGAAQTLSVGDRSYSFFHLSALEQAGIGHIHRLPFSIKILLENLLRKEDGLNVRKDDIPYLASWDGGKNAREISFMPSRVLLQDFTGVPAVVDLAAMRDALKALGADPNRANPLLPADLVIDHSVQVDVYGSAGAFLQNALITFERNRERYAFLRWGQSAFRNFRVVPPDTGIVHQVNLEYLASVVFTQGQNGTAAVYPDSLVGTDSHTTMINGLGVMGWGVGGIEAEACMLGQPISMLVPEVIGFKLFGKLREGATATDLVLTVTQMLRKKGVVGKFVEFYGQGVGALSLADRATIANMAPEYGATMGFFPVDDRTLAYLRLTGRSADEIDLVERYCKEQGLFRSAARPDPQYTQTLDLDLATVVPSVAGPKRPQDRVALGAMQSTFRAALRAPAKQRGFELAEPDLARSAEVRTNGTTARLTHGTVVIGAITSCTNTSNPSVMVAAGLVARKAVARGLRVKPWVKTSLAPGSRVVTDYLDRAGLTADLDALGFQTVGYGCTTCIGNSGPLPDHVRAAVQAGDLVVASVLSGNRNFEGRINPHVKANYLASPPLVVAYALAGTVDIDLANEPLGQDDAGRPVYLRDIWPTTREVADTVAQCVTPEAFSRRYADVFRGSPEWQRINAGSDPVYAWQPASTYIQEPPFFQNFAPAPAPIAPLRGARCLAVLGDSVTTDHISPAGSIKADSPAGRFLQDNGVTPDEFNSYGARRGNDRVMTRGTFANVRLRNLLAPGTEGGVTTFLPTGAVTTIHDAATRYQAAGTPLVILAGKDYGMGSSRDWAAKGTLLLGVRAVLAESFERIHRTNLVCMGVLPLQFHAGPTREALGLTGREVFDLPGLDDQLRPGQDLTVVATDPQSGARREFAVRCRVDTPVEVAYYRHGGVLPLVLRNMLKS